jgi:DNA-binding MarR family transcriptional regulator
MAPRSVSKAPTCHHGDIMSSEPTADDYRALLAEVYDLAGRSRRLSEAEAASRGSTAARWLAMSALVDSDLTAATVARRLGLPRQAVHRVVDDLVAQGHVVKVANPDHARSELVSLTPEGRSVVAALRSDSDPHRLRLLELAGVAHEDVEAAREVLARLVRAFKQTDP